MATNYLYHTVTAESLQALTVADTLCDSGARQIEAAGGVLFGVWRSQIGRPRDELTVMTAWPGMVNVLEVESLIGNIQGVSDHNIDTLLPTVKPETAEPPRKQGLYAFRWFDVPGANWEKFLDLCVTAWPGWESSYDSKIIGLWRQEPTDSGLIRSLLLSRRPSLAMWERTKNPKSDDEIEVRNKMGRRYDLCTWTSVYTTTLISTAEDGGSDKWP